MNLKISMGKMDFDLSGYTCIIPHCLHILYHGSTSLRWFYRAYCCSLSDVAPWYLVLLWLPHLKCYMQLFCVCFIIFWYLTGNIVLTALVFQNIFRILIITTPVLNLTWFLCLNRKWFHALCLIHKLLIMFLFRFFFKFWNFIILKYKHVKYI